MRASLFVKKGSEMHRETGNVAAGPSARSVNKRLLIIIGIAATLRLFLALQLPAEKIWRDGRTYNRIARYVLSEGRWPVRGKDRIIRPVHPMVLAAVYSLPGTDGSTARITMALLGTLTCWVVFRLGRILFDESVGLIAALMLGVYPLHVYLSALFEYPQNVFALILCMTVLQLISLAKSQDTWFRWIIAGALLGLAALTVPTILTAAPLIAIWLFVVRKRRWTGQVVRVAVFTLSCSCLLFSWNLYQYHLTGRFNNGGHVAGALFLGNCPLAWVIGKADIVERYELEEVPPEHKQAYDEYMAVVREAGQYPPGSDRDKIYNAAVNQYFSERPAEAIGLLGKKALMYWYPFAQTVTRHGVDNLATKIVQTWTFVPIFILACIGIRLQKSKRRILTCIYLIVLSQWLTYTIFFPSVRYRSSIDPLLIVLAAATLVSIVNNWKMKARRVNPATEVGTT